MKLALPLRNVKCDFSNIKQTAEFRISSCDGRGIFMESLKIYNFISYINGSTLSLYSKYTGMTVILTDVVMD